MTRSKEHQEKIDMINGWVQDFFDGDETAGDKLIDQFEPFLNKSCNRFMKYYQGVFEWDTAIQEARIIFYELLREYTIGGTAYFNVYIQKKLPLRLRYCFVKEIKRRTRDLSHSDEQFAQNGLLGADEREDYDDLLESEENRFLLQQAMKAIEISDLTDRERDMFLSHMNGESHTSIASRYSISRSRVSRIIKNTVEKIQERIDYKGNIKE